MYASPQTPATSSSGSLSRYLRTDCYFDSSKVEEVWTKACYEQVVVRRPLWHENSYFRVCSVEIHKLAANMHVELT